MFKKLTLKRFVHALKLAFFYCMNSRKFKRLDFTALISSPLRVDGRKYISLYKKAKVQKFSWLIALKIDDHDPELIIREGCYIGDFNHIAAVRRVVIGKNVITANRVYISDNAHAYEDIAVPIMHQPVRLKSEVSIGDGSWLGENVCVIGAKIGRNCVVGANSVVTSDIPDYCVAVGAPAKVIKKYNVQTEQWERVG